MEEFNQNTLLIEYETAPIELRAINYIVDTILRFSLVMFWLVVIVSISLFGSLSKGEEYLLAVFVYYLVSFLYYFLLERFLGRSFGKYFTKTQVIDATGERSTSRIIKRTLARLIPFDEFSIFFNNQRCWHDTISDTWVVKSSSLPQEKRPRKSVDITMTILTVLLLMMPFGSVALYSVYNELTGGERINLPAQMPADLRLTEFNKYHEGDRSFFGLVYTSDVRTIRINQLIAGFDYDPDDPCGAMIPMEQPSLNNSKIKGYDCKIIYRNPYQKSTIVVKQTYIGVSGQRTNLPIASYYITDPPFRLLITAERGSITQDEVINMAKNGLRAQKEDELKNSTK